MKAIAKKQADKKKADKKKMPIRDLSKIIEEEKVLDLSTCLDEVIGA